MWISFKCFTFKQMQIVPQKGVNSSFILSRNRKNFGILATWQSAFAFAITNSEFLYFCSSVSLLLISSYISICLFLFSLDIFYRQVLLSLCPSNLTLMNLRITTTEQKVNAETPKVFMKNRSWSPCYSQQSLIMSNIFKPKIQKS